MNFNYYDQDSNEFWSSFSQSFAVPDPRDEFYPGIISPIPAMPISMAVDVPAEPWKVLEDGDKDVGLWNNAAAEVDAIKNDELLQAIIAWKPMEEGKEKEKEKGKEKEKEKGKGKEKEKEDVSVEETMTLSKRRRGNTEGRNLTEKRRRTDINAKIKTLKELTRCTEKKDLVTSLDCIISKITEMKQYVEGFYYPPPMMPPMDMGMDYRPGPWMYPYNYVHPQYMMRYNYNPYIYGQTSGYGNEMVPAAAVPTYQGVNYEPETANPM